jgi:hypothetical protein
MQLLVAQALLPVRVLQGAHSQEWLCYFKVTEYRSPKLCADGDWHAFPDKDKMD